MAEAIVQVTQKNRNWWLEGCKGNDVWTAEGPIETYKQAMSLTAEYAVLCGFDAFRVTVDE